MRVVDFDTWRDTYAAMSFADQVQFHSLIWQDYPRQQHYDLACVDEFFASTEPSLLRVLEIGGWTGDVAKHVISKPRLYRLQWTNVELCAEAAAAFKHDQYDAMTLDDFIWNQPPSFFAPYNVLFMSHSIEHLDVRDLVALAPNLGHMKWLYVDTPLPEDRAALWMGDVSTHKLEMSWPDLREFWEARGWTLIGERNNEQEQSMARWFRRG